MRRSAQLQAKEALGLLVSCLTLGMLLAACADDPIDPPDDFLDGNVVVGDARWPDATPRDTGATDALDGGGLDADARGDPADTGGLDADGATDAGSRCEQTPEATLTASSAASEAGMFDGRVVDIVGTATVAALTCTEIACPPEMPCCNRCVAGVQIDALVTLATSTCTARVGCEGDECAQVCTPPILGFPQTFRGVLRDAPGGPTLELERVLP